MSENHLSDLRFDSLQLHESIQAGIRDAGFELVRRGVTTIEEVLRVTSV